MEVYAQESHLQGVYWGFKEGAGGMISLASSEQSISDSPEVMRSIYSSQDEILSAIKTLHCSQGFECDMTYGNGVFWKTIPRPAKCFDITPLHSHVERGDSKMLPLEKESISNCIYDPPFMTYVRNGRNHKDGNMMLAARFGGYWRYDELEDDYRHTISEAYRILRPGGKLIFKCQDIIHNHRMHCTHARVILMAESEGFRLLDLFILAAKHRMPSPQKGRQRHARIFHSYFLVFERDSGKPARRKSEEDDV